MTFRVSLATLLLLNAGLAGCKEDKKCEPGDICTWFGTPEISGMSPEGTHREEASTLGRRCGLRRQLALIMDWNNHRVVTLDEDEKIVVLTGVGEIGDGPGRRSDSRVGIPPMSLGSRTAASSWPWHNSRSPSLIPTSRRWRLSQEPASAPLTATVAPPPRPSSISPLDPRR